MGKYYGWHIDEEARRAQKIIDGEEVGIEIEQRTEGTWEGWWPEKPLETRGATVVTGVCLWDARWQLEFVREGKNPPGRRVLSQTTDREDALNRVRSGKVPQTLYIPRDLGAYHTRLIDWQTEVLQELQPELILYHLPHDEYTVYLQEVEEVLGRSLPEAREHLAVFAEAVRARLIAGLGPTLSQRLTFVRPMLHGASTPEESWSLPYHRSELFGAREGSQLIGVETLDELRSAWSLRHVRTVPVRCLVPGLPDPYAQKTLTPENSIAISLL